LLDESKNKQDNVETSRLVKYNHYDKEDMGTFDSVVYDEINKHSGYNESEEVNESAKGEIFFICIRFILLHLNFNL
jgi:hypothetical protein